MKPRSSRIGWVLLAVFVLVVGVTGYRWHTERKGKAELAAVIAEIESTDPAWTEDALTVPPVDVTSNTVVAIVGRSQNLFPKPFGEQRYRANGKNFMDDIPPNARLDDDALVLLEHALEGCQYVRPVARQLLDVPTGYRDRETEPNERRRYYFTGDTSTHLMRRFIEYETERFNVAGASDRALRCVRTLCHLAGVYDHPACWHLLSGVDGRLSEVQSAVLLLERVLGMGTPRAELAATQAAFMREANVDYEAQVRHAHRANIHTFYLQLEGGAESLAETLETISQAGTGGMCLTLNRSPDWKVRAAIFRPHLYADHAAALRYYTQMVEIGQLPTHQRNAASYALAPPTNGRYVIAQALAKYDTYMYRRAMNAQALVRCAVVALACERYRQLVGQWPTTVDAIPKALLPETPLDPYIGEALLLKVRDDGLTVYSVGSDGKDHGGDLPRNDVGFRLYNPDSRRIAPRPVPPPDPSYAEEPTPPVLGPMPREVPLP